MRTETRRQFCGLLLIAGLLVGGPKAGAQPPAIACRPTDNGTWRPLDPTGAIYTLEPGHPADYPTKGACDAALNTALAPVSEQHCLAANDWTSRVPNTDAPVFRYHVRLTSSCTRPFTCELDTVPGGRSTLTLAPGASRVATATGEVGILPSFRYRCR